MEPKEKQKLKVYYDDLNLYIDLSSAYALNFIDVKEFYSLNDKYGPLSDNQIIYIKKQFDLEFYKLPIDKIESKKNKISCSF